MSLSREASVLVLVLGGGGGRRGRFAPAASSVTCGAGSSELSAPIHWTTLPFAYVWLAGNVSVWPGVLGKWALRPHSANSPTPIFPPDQVTTRPLCVRVQPGFKPLDTLRHSVTRSPHMRRIAGTR